MRIFNNLGKERTLRDVFILLIVLVFGVSIFLAYRKTFIAKDFFYKDNLTYIKPVTLDALPAVFDNWPIELDNVLSKFYLDSQKPVDKQYVAVYKSSKSTADVVKLYKQFFTDQKIQVYQTATPGVDHLYAMLKSQNSQAEVDVENKTGVQVTLTYTTYIPGFTVPDKPPIPMAGPIVTKSIPIPSLTLPVLWSKNFPQLPKAKITQSYNIENANLGGWVGGKIVFSTEQSFDAVKNFYKSKLTGPEYKLVSDKNSLVFLAKQGLLTIVQSKAVSDAAIIQVTVTLSQLVSPQNK